MSSLSFKLKSLCAVSSCYKKKHTAHSSRLALTAMNKYPEAISYFKKALVLDPENDTYKSNLKIAEQKQKEATSPVSNTNQDKASLALFLCNEAFKCVCAADRRRTGVRHGQFNQQPCLHQHGKVTSRS